jgi:hypothetical protein
LSVFLSSTNRELAWLLMILQSEEEKCSIVNT